MRTRLVQFAVILLLLVYLCAPLFESVDHWDHFPQSGHDIVLTVMGAALCLGITLALMRIVLQAIGAGLATRSLVCSASHCPNRSIFRCPPLTQALSPPVLRI
jgi:hypothetical protein